MGRKNWTDEKLFFRLVNNKSDKTYWDNIRELRSILLLLTSASTAFATPITSAAFKFDNGSYSH